MYRFLSRPKWIAFTLLCVAVIVTMVNLGFWQLRRLDQRKAFNREVSTRTAAAPVEYSSLAASLPGDREWRAVQLNGTYASSPPEQVPTSGGYLLVSPFVATNGTTVYVDRGYVGSAATIPPVPTGTVSLSARFLTPPSGARTVPQGGAYLDRISSSPDEPQVAPHALPTLDEGPHLSYAIQWFIFSVCVVIGWVLAVRRSAGAVEAGTETRTRKRSKHDAVPWQDEAARS